MDKLLFLDSETGGLNKESSLLTLSAIVTGSDLSIQEELNLSIKPSDGNYVVSAQALEINKINLSEHWKTSESIDVCKQKLYEFIKKNSEDGKNKLIPCGHGIVFDLRKIWDVLLRRSSWEQFCSYRTIDTGAVARTLILAGIIPGNIHGSLEAYCKYFNITVGVLHTARDDNLASIELLYNMKNLLKDLNCVPKSIVNDWVLYKAGKGMTA